MKCCEACFLNENIRKYIEENGSIGKCDYTNLSGLKVIDTKTLGIYIRKCLSKKYEYVEDDVANYDWESRRYVCTVYSLRKILLEKDFISSEVDREKLLKDIFMDSKDETDVFNTHGILESEDDLEVVVKGSSNSGQDSTIFKSWSYFKYIIKHYSRYFDFDNAHKRESYLESIKRYFPRYETTVSSKTFFYRLRDTKTKFNLYYDIESEIGPPPVDKTYSNNRMSPSGISYLYVSDDEQSTYAEIGASALGEIFVLGEFVSKRDLKILDFTKNVNFNVDIFAPDYREDDNWVESFFKEFIEEITQPVDKTKEDHSYEYIATQVIAEFIRLMGYDGIKYPSSVARGNAFVFFCGPEQDNNLCFHSFPIIPCFRDWFEVKSVWSERLINIMEKEEIVEEEDYWSEVHCTVKYPVTKKEYYYCREKVEKLK